MVEHQRSGDTAVRLPVSGAAARGRIWAVSQVLRPTQLRPASSAGPDLGVRFRDGLRVWPGAGPDQCTTNHTFRHLIEASDWLDPGRWMRRDFRIDDVKGFPPSFSALFLDSKSMADKFAVGEISTGIRFGQWVISTDRACTGGRAARFVRFSTQVCA